eukprot:15362003-Ditylum_brightwellii.AAC.1
MELCEKAKTPESTDVHIVNIQDSLKYFILYNDGESLGEDTSGKLIYQEIDAISTDSSSKICFQTIRGKSFSNGVKVVLTDGNWNELTPVDVSFKSNFQMATRQRCGWHIVDRGWSRHLDSVVSCSSPIYQEQFS